MTLTKKEKENEMCVNCGTVLAWWANKSKRNKVYRLSSDEYFCSKKCINEYHESDLPKDVTKDFREDK